MEALSQSFRALGDPTRLRILRLLSETPLNVSELVSVVGVAQSSISHHLAKLRAMGLLKEERQAGFTYYSLVVGRQDPKWPLIQLARQAGDEQGDKARLTDLLRSREDRRALNERLLEPGQSWSLWAGALASLLPPLDVVDFGCGSGTLSVTIARWARTVTAVDRSASALAQVRERAERLGLTNLTFLEEDLHASSLPSGKKGLVVLSQSLHHMERPEQVLKEAARILKPGGHVVVLELAPHEETWVLERLGHRHLGFEPEKLSALLRQCGFTALRQEVPAREEDSSFRAFLMTGVKRR